MATQFGDGVLFTWDFPHDERVGGLVVIWVWPRQMWAGPVQGRLDEAVGAGDGREGRREPAEGREGREGGNTWRKRRRGRRGRRKEGEEEEQEEEEEKVFQCKKTNMVTKRAVYTYIHI